MIELDTQTLRRALRTSADTADTVDVALIVRRGRSLRRRRRVVAVAGTACAAAVIFGALTAITQLTSPATAPPRYPISGRTAPGPSPRHPLPTVSRRALATPEPKATPTTIPSPRGTGREPISVTHSPVASGTASAPSPSGTPSPTASTVPGASSPRASAALATPPPSATR